MTHFLQRTSLIALMTGALGACTTAEPLRPNFPIDRTAPAPGQPPVRTPAPPPAAASQAPVPTVEEAPLAQTAPPPPVDARPLQPLTPAPQAQAPAQRPAAPAQPTYRTVTARTVTGRVVDVDGPAVTYEVKSGDNLEKIAKKLGTTVDQLRADNDLKKGAAIHPGDELKGPTSSAKAYVVGQGDTLFAIARRFTVTPEAIAEENRIGRATSLRVGQRLRLPEGFRDKGPITTTTRVAVTPSQAPDAEPIPVRETPAPTRPAATPTRASDPEPTYTTSTRRLVTGRVVDVEGKPVTYTVKKGDNLEKIADRLGTTVAQLREDNDLKRNAVIQPGDELKGPTSTAKAYVANGPDTLAQIARRFGVTEAALRTENGLSRNATVRGGQRIRLPSGYRDRGALTETVRTPIARPVEPAPTPIAPTPEPARVPVQEPAPVLPSTPRPYTPGPGVSAPAQAQPRPSAPVTQPQAQPRPATPATQPPAQTAPRPYTPPPQSRPTTPAPSSSGPPQAPVAAPTAGDAQISELGRGRFVWPLQGQIVSDYGPKGGGQRNDGINIAATAGAPVRAAAAGDVVYAGDQVPGFGNLVLIKHADGWVTAYGHLDRVDVKMQQKIAQGQQIGQAGSSGGVPTTQLHFEIRYASSPLERARPIDPKLVLPR
ncbi:LysM peptidoglycan-binding domain-containing protein [Phenylobacterium deserti]|uniref:Peptidase M24 n=1 Tax=Phenylobacterium deserti TaxID=1914756 RepID=A0A328ACN0_9CAUL|nr:LysM peptidoglycan-binding domain-containing protein [Phenylobacterium deserti]RAK52355.1 peptidase M24 [Phenylobacterium deserti]